MRSVNGYFVALAALAGSACHTMRPVTLDQLGGLQPDHVWVQRGDQGVVEVSHPQVLGDTLVGFVNRKYEVMPGANLTEVLVRRSAGGRTAALLAVSGVGLAGIAYLIAGSGKSGPDVNAKCAIFEVGSDRKSVV